MKVRGLSPSDVGLPDLERYSTHALVSEVVKPTWNQVCLEVGDCGRKTSRSNTQAGTPISRDLRPCRRFIKDAKSAAMSYSHLCLELRPSSPPAPRLRGRRSASRQAADCPRWLPTGRGANEAVRRELESIARSPSSGNCRSLGDRPRISLTPALDLFFPTLIDRSPCV